MEKIKSSALQLCKWVNTHRSSIVFFTFILVVFASIPSVVLGATDGSSGTADAVLANAGTAAMDISDFLSNPLETLFDAILLLLAWILAITVTVIGKLIVVVLGALIIPILGYNNFGDSHIISIGWPLVRDVVNMFVIVVLLVIAIQTIIGYKDAKWATQLPRFFLAVVLVNFSRTISLLMIDVSQVVMFTFVNALRDIAAGNFMNLFQINEFSDIGANMGSGIETFQMFAELSVTLSLLLIVLGTLVILAVVYLYRIIVLWVLVILSPIAFFLGGIAGLFGEAGGRYKQWWNMFVAALTLGPILTFFLWLALAAASTGPIATSEGMNFAGTDDVPTLLAAIFASEKMVSLSIGLILIMTGFKVASSVAQTLGNVASKFVTDDIGKKMTKNMLMLPASASYRGAKWGGKQAGRQIVGHTGLGKQLGAGMTGMGKEMAAKGGVFGGVVGRGLIGAGGKVGAAWEAPNVAGRAKAREEVAGMTKDERVAHAAAAIDPVTGKLNKPVSLSAQRKQEAVMLDAVTDAGVRKQMKEDMDPVAYGKFMQASMKHVDKNKDELLTDDSAKKNFKKTKAGHLREWVDGKGLAGKAAKTEINGILSDSDFKLDQLSDKDLAEAKDKPLDDIRQALEGKKIRAGYDSDNKPRYESMFERAKSGQGVSEGAQEAALHGFTGEIDLSSATIDQLANATKANKFDGSKVTAADVADPATLDKLVKGMAKGGGDFGGFTTTAISTAMANGLRSFYATRPAMSNNEKTNVRKSMLSAGVAPGRPTPAAGGDHSIEQVFNITGGNIGAGHGSTQELSVILKSDPIKYMDQVKRNMPAAGSAGNDMTEALMKSYSKETADKVLREFRDAAPGPDRDAKKDVIDQYRNAYNAEKLLPEAGRAHSDDQLKNINRQLKLIEDQM